MANFDHIYQNHADQYDRLIEHEDWQNSLGTFLLNNFDWKGKTVFEAGVGTGRVTALYGDLAAQLILTDGSAHMLARAKTRLAAMASKLHFDVRDNLDLVRHGETADIFIEGWSFGHTVVSNPANQEITVEMLIQQANKIIQNQGSIIWIETFGTGVDQAAAPSENLSRFYELLENQYGFKRHILQTDYQFESVAAATEICGFFFGDWMAERVKSRYGAIIPEFTGVWVLNQ